MPRGGDADVSRIQRRYRRCNLRKTFVLDTNVLIHDSESISKFEENDVVIPMIVIEELDRLKKGHSEIAYSARHALKKKVILPRSTAGNRVRDCSRAFQGYPLMFHAI